MFFIQLGLKMKYASRWAILFIMTLLASRISPGFVIEEHWYSFVWALIIGGINAAIRLVLLSLDIVCSWTLIGIISTLLNLLLFGITFAGAFTWLGLTVTSFGGALLAAVIVIISSTICNHFIGIKGPDK